MITNNNLSAAPSIRLEALSQDDGRLREAAMKLEAGFLSEMLKSAGLDGAAQGFAGGPGEEHFASFLRDAQAREMVAAGGIGLAESLFEIMKARRDA